MTTATTTTMTESELRKRLDHLRFTEADARLLESLRPWAETSLKDFAREFYNQQFSNPDFAAIVKGNNSSQDALEQAQAGYALDLFKGYPNLNYVASRVSIGKTHVRINITPEWYIASY